MFDRSYIVELDASTLDGDRESDSDESSGEELHDVF
jgi:hypothetical protein